jgi:hypothetical protein
MLEWEYCMIHLSDLPRKIDEIDLLNDVGEGGWELVAITTNNIAYLKRQVAAPTARSGRLPRRKTAGGTG